jgi:soluble lytic murein transglycosylase
MIASLTCAALAASLAGAPLAGDTAAVRRATAAVTAGLATSDPVEAAASFARAARAVPAFGDWAHVLSARAASPAGDTAAVRRHLAAADPALAREWGWRSRVAAALAAGDSVGAAWHAEAAAAEIADAARRAEAWSRAGAIHAAAGRHREATFALRAALEASVAPAAALDAARLLEGLPGIGAGDLLLIGRAYIQHRELDRAARVADLYAAARPRTPEPAQLQLDLGRAFFAARRYADAEARLHRAAALAREAPDLAAEAMHLLGRTQYRQGLTNEARATFLRVTREFAGTATAARAHFQLGDIDHDAGRLEAARTHYRGVIDAGGPDAALAAWRLAGLDLLAGRARAAAATFGASFGQAQTVAARQQAGYGWALALDRAGAGDSARLVLEEVQAADPFSYYGLLAGDRIGVSPWQLAPSPHPTVPASLGGEISGRVDALDVLRGARMEEAATLEAARLVDRYGALEGALYALGAAYHAREQTLAGVRIGRELRRREGAWNRALLELVYPFPYRAAIQREARAHGLDPYLVAGLIRQESLFNPRARSAAGAMGLMQIMPATGTRLARTLGVAGFQSGQLNDPAVNLRMGSRYLADQLRSYGGSVTDALAAYNAGPSRVTRWRDFPEYGEPEVYVERIPFQETREYVKVVQQNARIYRALYGGAGP